ncbi:hypothetical protein WJX72_007525 [[Myrmecia] bisecta]|uniref:ODAD1 central coiled coil region domain-containing protein n=1 Tax=[Myrmecia] bisecta TaxID=41462 RepID=A0AAW1R7W0_9CHLO
MLSEGRRKLIDSSQAIMKQNRTAIQALKQENKELKTRLAAAAPQRQASKSQIERELEEMERQANRLRREHDKLVQERAQQAAKLAHLQDSIKELQHDACWALQETPSMQHIRELERNLDQALIKLNEACGIKHTYEQIVERLKSERLGFNSQLRAVEDTLHNKAADLQDLLKLSQDSQQAHDQAKLSAQHEEACLAEERALRAAQLQQQRQLVKMRGDVFRHLEQHETKRQDEHAEMEGDMSAAEEELIKQRNAAQLWMSAVVRFRRSKVQVKIQSCEDALRHIREVTGVHDISDVVEKFVTHDATRASLEQLQREAEQRVEALNARKAKLQELLSESLLAERQPASIRDLEIESEHALLEVDMQCKRLQAQAGRMSKVMVDVKAGMEHLATMLAIHTAAPVTDANLLQTMHACEATLRELWSDIQADPAAAQALAAAQTAAHAHTALLAAQKPPPATNVRTSMYARSAAQLAQGDPHLDHPDPGPANGQGGESPQEEDNEEEVPDRMLLKQLSSRRALSDGSQTSRHRTSPLSAQLVATSQRNAGRANRGDAQPQKDIVPSEAVLEGPASSRPASADTAQLVAASEGDAAQPEQVEDFS